MSVSALILSFSLLMLVALMLWPVARKWLLPYPMLLVLAGFLGSEWLISQGVDTGLRWSSFRDLVYYVLLPVIMYEAAFFLNAERFFENLFIILVLGIPLMLLSALLTASVIYMGIVHTSGLTAIAAGVAGLLLSATNPPAILNILQRLHAPERVINALKGEALFNNVLALILVTLLIQFVVINEHDLGLFDGFVLFTRMFMGGLLLGLLSGGVGWLLMQWNKTPVLRAVISLVTLFSGYLLAESLFHVSGLVSVLVTGLIFNALIQKQPQEDKVFLYRLWRYKAFVARVLLFFLLGVSVQPFILLTHWDAVLLGIIAVLLARIVIVYMGLWVFLPSRQYRALRMSDKNMLVWGNIKGAVTIALLLSLPDTLLQGNTIVAMAYGVILFSLFVQAPTIRFLLQRSSARYKASTHTKKRESP